VQANHIYSMMRLQAKITYNGVRATDRLKGPFPEHLFGIGSSADEWTATLPWTCLSSVLVRGSSPALISLSS